MGFKEELEQFLMGGELQAEPQLERTAGGRVGGFILSEKFAGMKQVDRQELLWRLLEERFSREELQAIVVLLTMTRREAGLDEPEEADLAS